MLDSLDINDKELRVVRNIYREQNAAIKIDNEISPFIKVKRRVRQRCVFSPDLFNHLKRHSRPSCKPNRRS